MLTGIVFDALDVAALEGFWQHATRGRSGGLRLRFEPTEQPKVGKNRLHLDLAGGPDWPAEVDRLLRLGAVRTDIGQGDVPWDVLADPEGNEFCVLRPHHPGTSVDAGLCAICLDMAEDVRGAQTAFWQAATGWSVVEEADWGVRLRRAATGPVSLVMGPPAAPKRSRNRLRLEVAEPGAVSGERLHPGGNELHVHPWPGHL
jgi:hypothetical protein